MIDKSGLERKKTGTATEREEDGRRRKKGIDIQSGGRKRNGISLLFLQAPLMEFQDVADTLVIIPISRLAFRKPSCHNAPQNPLDCPF
jgi:hypothetical protein